MKKPLAPKKPTKNASPPDEYENCMSIIAEDIYTDDPPYVIRMESEEGVDEATARFVKALNGDTYDKYDDVIYLVDNIDGLFLINVINDLIDNGAQEVELTRVWADSIGDSTLPLGLSYKMLKDPAVYAQEMEAYKNRFTVYGEQHTAYKKELEVYEADKLKQRKARLEKELADCDKKIG